MHVERPSYIRAYVNNFNNMLLCSERDKNTNETMHNDIMGIAPSLRKKTLFEKSALLSKKILKNMNYFAKTHEKQIRLN